MLAETERWLSDTDLQRIYTAEYWNDIEEERKKEWWIENGDYDRCREYLDRSGLLAEYRQAEAFIADRPSTNLRVIDLAAGIGWTSALISRLPNVSEVIAVEISRHRLERLFPHAVRMFDGQAQKLRRCIGSFYDLHLPDASADVIFLSQAFHHADRPLHLLTECDRVLKPGGRIIVVGEHWIGARRIVRRFLSVLLRERRIITDVHRLFPPDDLLGDHCYRRSDYYLLFGALGYAVSHRHATTNHMIYVADKAP